MKSSKKRRYILFYSLAIAALLQSCNLHSDLSVAFKKIDTYLINDERGFIRHKPNRMLCENDSEVNILINPDKYLRYCCQSNNLSVLFDSIHFNIDSIIQFAYKNTIKGKTNYLEHSAEKLKNIDKSVFKLTPAVFKELNNYYPLSILLEYEYNPENLVNITDKKVADSVWKRFGNAKLIEKYYEYFVISTDKNNNQLEVIPLINDATEMFLGNYKGCFVNGSHLYCPLIKNASQAPKSNTLKGFEPNFFFMDYTFEKNKTSKESKIIDKKIINSDQYNANIFASTKISYFYNDKKVIASMGKEMVNLTDNSLYSIQPVLEEKEYLSNFSFSKRYLFYTTNLYEKSKNISSQIGNIGVTDSIARSFLKVQDLKSNEIIYNKELLTYAVYAFTPANNLFEYYEKKDSLFLNKYTISINE